MPIREKYTDKIAREQAKEGFEYDHRKAEPFRKLCCEHCQQEVWVEYKYNFDTNNIKMELIKECEDGCPNWTLEAGKRPYFPTVKEKKPEKIGNIRI